MTERKGGIQNPAGDPSDGREIPGGTDEGADANTSIHTRDTASDTTSGRADTRHEKVARADHVPPEERGNNERQPKGAD
jgi:hypothetical protein